jgi:hypothetical protein
LLKKRFSGRGKPRFSRKVLPSPEEAAPPQFWDHVVDEIVEAAGHIREHDVEAVAGFAVEPLLHLVGDYRRRADQRETAMAAGDLRQLADRQIVAPKRSRWVSAFIDPAQLPAEAPGAAWRMCRQ